MQPDLVASVLTLLPPGVLALELHTPCSGPVLAALARFTQLEELVISGNVAGIDWHRSGAAQHALGLLSHLRLEYLEPVDNMYCESQPISDAFPSAVAATTRLEQLTVEARWSPAVVALCGALPPSLSQLE